MYIHKQFKSETSHLTAIGNNAFNGCDSLVEIKIPDSVTEIGICAFDNCTLLTTMSLSDSVTTIGSNAFSGCRSLKKIVLPDSVRDMELNVFMGCSALKTIVINGEEYDADCSDSAALLPEGCAQWCGKDIMYGYTLYDLIKARAEGTPPTEYFWCMNVDGRYRLFKTLKELKSSLA